MGAHIHKFYFDCEIKNGHKHKIIGYTDSMIGFNKIHFHFFYGISSYNNHSHYFSGITGFPVKTQNGHVHRMDGILETNNMHEHKYDDYTMEDIAYINDRLAKKALI